MVEHIGEKKLKTCIVAGILDDYLPEVCLPSSCAFLMGVPDLDGGNVCVCDGSGALSCRQHYNAPVPGADVEEGLGSQALARYEGELLTESMTLVEDSDPMAARLDVTQDFTFQIRFEVLEPLRWKRPYRSLEVSPFPVPCRTLTSWALD